MDLTVGLVGSQEKARFEPLCMDELRTLRRADRLPPLRGRGDSVLAFADWNLSLIGPQVAGSRGGRTTKAILGGSDHTGDPEQGRCAAARCGRCVNTTGTTSGAVGLPIGAIAQSLPSLTRGMTSNDGADRHLAVTR
jgi:hypothetical protein